MLQKNISIKCWTSSKKPEKKLSWFPQNISWMEARFCHWIKNKKGYCVFLSHNSDFFSQNLEI